MSEQFLVELKDRLLPLIKRMPQYVKLIANLAKDPNLPKAQKATLAAGIGYFASPLDLVPGIVPVIGQLDDILAVLLAIKAAMRVMSEADIKKHLDACGLEDDIINSDITLAKDTMVWILSLTYKQGKRGAQKAWKAISQKFDDITSGVPKKKYVRFGDTEVISDDVTQED